MAARPVSEPTARQWLEDAAQAFERGDRSAGMAALATAAAARPRDVSMQHGAGNLSLKAGEAAAAAAYFGRAATLDPDNVDFATDHGIALSSAGEYRAALTALARVEDRGRQRAVYCSARGAAARGAGLLAEAEAWYDAALAIEPTRARAIHGRARITLERGGDDAVSWFDRALSVNRSDADLWLGKAQALDVAGDAAGARQIAEALIEQAPAWIEGLKLLAQLRSAAGEADFAEHYGAAAKRVPQDPNIFSAWCAILAGSDRDAEAAEVAAMAQEAFRDEPHFAYLEAVYASTAGHLDRAEAIFNGLAKDDDDRWLQEARHRIRRGEPDRADALLGRVLDGLPWNISAWALRGAAWRMLGDARADWLHGSDTLVRSMPLRDGEAILPDAVGLLHELHDRSPFPLGQSLRGGTQTRGSLFDRAEPVLARLREAILRTLEDYRQLLPAADAEHPFLRARDRAWRMGGSWSVRLAGCGASMNAAADGGDFHTAHIHPQGLVSSALYCDLPEPRGSDPQAGWLEIGRPAADLRTDLPPLRTVEPRVGHLALFPSILYHGTRPFEGGRRMTVAFDIDLQQGDMP